MNTSDVSISMLIDNDIHNDTDKSNINGYTPLPIKSCLNIDERKIYQWVPDENVLKCNECNVDFSMMNRRHHCRNCGKIFCYYCSNHFIKIPKNIQTVPKEINIYHYKTYLDYFNLSSDKERVCEKCYIKIQELTELNKTIAVFDLLDLDVLDYMNISQVCKSWNKIAKYYLSYFREIQYYFSDHSFTVKDKLILYNNRLNLLNHSKWMLQLVLSIEWNSDNDIKIKHDVLHHLKSTLKSKSNISCRRLMCTRCCKSKLQTEDLIIILSKKYTYAPLVKYIINALYDISEIELTCYLNYIVNLLFFYKNYTIIANELEDYLLNKCSDTITLSNQLFWTITQCLSNPDSFNYFSNLRLKLVKILSKNTYALFQNGYDFTLNLIQIANNSNDNIVPKLIEYLTTYTFDKKGFYLPINFAKSFTSIDITKIRAIDSKTKPIILPCTYEDGKIFNIMLKKEDIRKEEIIMKIIKLMDYFLKEEEGLDLYVTIYNILPISSEYGYIEFVPDSTTLYHIREGLKFSIQNYILEQNPQLSIHELRDKLSKSCAVYCVITYLLGIGDRHLDNIMITKEGILFHIDFGYILGSDPKPIKPDIRLTPEMIDAMGGPKSKYYKKFKEYCGKAYNCLRRHAPIFYVLLLHLTECIPAVDPCITKEHIRNHILQRFIPGEKYTEAEQQFNYTIDNNSNTYSEDIIDFFHKKYKSASDSTSKSLSDHSVNIMTQATNTANNVKKTVNDVTETVQKRLMSLSSMFITKL